MGRICQMIRVGGRDHWTLFDTGARNTYVVPEVASTLTTSRIEHPFRSALGGEVKETRQTALLEGEVEGRRISTHAMVIDEIGNDESGTRIEILFGALAMQQWGIRPVPDEEKLAVVSTSLELAKFTIPGPLTLLQVVTRFGGKGKSSSVTVPSKLAVFGKVIV